MFGNIGKILWKNVNLWYKNKEQKFILIIRIIYILGVIYEKI